MNAQIKNNIFNWSQDHKSGWTLPRSFYMQDDAFAADLELFRTHWIYAASLADFKDEGDYLLVEIAGESVILIRNEEGAINGFHNVCCHRGSQVLLEKQGACANIVCHYHQWTYNMEGQLIFAGSMGSNFDCSKFRLQSVAVESIGGLIFICLSDTPPDISPVRDMLAPYVQPYEIDKMKVAYTEELVLQANWKLAMENNRECYHCNSNHPELLHPLYAQGFGFGTDGDDPDALAVDDESQDEYAQLMVKKEAEWQKLGLNYAIQDYPNNQWARVARLPLANNAVSMTVDGKPACDKRFAPFPYPEGSTLSLWGNPNSWNHFLSDHVVTACVFPITSDTCKVITKWLVHEDAKEGVDYDLHHLTHVWKQTNAQDARLFESVMQGLRSHAYAQGLLAPQEKFVAQFIDWYVDHVQQTVSSST